MKRILVIKLGALGDFFQAFGPFQAIRNAHPEAHITLLTTAPYIELAVASGWFDAVKRDTRPKLRHIGRIWALWKLLCCPGFDRVYDLQTNSRTRLYFHMTWPRHPEWSGAVAGCSHPHNNSQRNNMHTLERQKEQLEMAGIDAIPAPNLDWLSGHSRLFFTADRFILLIPGGAAHRPEKRWPASNYGALANHIMDRGILPVILGAQNEAEEAEKIIRICPKAKNLVGRTGIFDLAKLAENAIAAVGNDTGPMHLAATIGCPSLVLYSQASNPDLCAQRGPVVEILRCRNLDHLPLQDVTDSLDKMIA